MKIGIDARLWNQTGVGRYIRNLVYNLEVIDKRNEYYLFLRDQDLDKINIINKNFKTIKANIKWHTIEEQLELPPLLDKYNLDLVHFPYYSVPVFYKKPFVVTIHDLIPFHFNTGEASNLPYLLYKIKFFFYKEVISRAAKNSLRIISPSNFSKKEILKFFNVSNSKVKVVYEGTDKTLINSPKMIKDKNYFLYIGNAYPHKNLEILIDVFAELPNLKLILVGKEDSFYRKIKKKAQQFPNISFFGYANDKELSQLYKKAKALIMPSFIEGFGLPALEAMSNRCLVLASDIPTLREICQEAAVYFDPKSKESLKKNIIKTSEQKLDFLIDKGIQRTKDFSWKKTAEETLKIYQDCLPGSFA